MERITAHIKSIIVVTLLLMLACSVMKHSVSIFNPEILDTIQALAQLFLVLFCLPVALYLYNTNRRKKILKKFSD